MTPTKQEASERAEPIAPSGAGAPVEPGPPPPAEAAPEAKPQPTETDGQKEGNEDEGRLLELGLLLQGFHVPFRSHGLSVLICFNGFQAQPDRL